MLGKKSLDDIYTVVSCVGFTAIAVVRCNRNNCNKTDREEAEASFDIEKC